MSNALCEMRCSCGKLLCKAHGVGEVEIKCTRCKALVRRRLEDIGEQEARKSYVSGND